MFSMLASLAFMAGVATAGVSGTALVIRGKMNQTGQTEFIGIPKQTIEKISEPAMIVGKKISGR
ncbi:MAG: hypothetical protein ACRCXZ_04485 [Patescibacteria group bacterium]